MTKKLAGKGCSGWKMAGVLLTVARGDGSRLSDQQGVRTIGRRGPLGRDNRAGLFAILTPPRTSGFSCSRVELPLLTHMRC
jgi:hypothetical protein